MDGNSTNCHIVVRLLLGGCFRSRLFRPFAAFNSSESVNKQKETRALAELSLQSRAASRTRPAGRRGRVLAFGKHLPWGFLVAAREKLGEIG